MDCIKPLKSVEEKEEKKVSDKNCYQALLSMRVKSVKGFSHADILTSVMSMGKGEGPCERVSRERIEN